MISKEIRNKAFSLFGDAFLKYIHTAEDKNLRIADSYFHRLTPELANHLWSARNSLTDCFDTRESWMELVGTWMFISYMGMPVSDIITAMQSQYDEKEWDFMIVDEAYYSLVMPADLLLGYGRYEIFDYDIERMAIGLKLLKLNNVEMRQLSAIAEDMIKLEGAVIWEHWSNALNHPLEISEDLSFEEQLKEVFLYNINLFYDFADQDNFDQDDRMYPILTKELAEHLIACHAVADAEEWRREVGKRVYIWQYDVDALLTPEEILECKEFPDGQWYFMTHQDARNFLKDVEESIRTAGNLTMVHLWWTGSMLYFLEKQ